MLHLCVSVSLCLSLSVCLSVCLCGGQECPAILWDHWSVGIEQYVLMGGDLEEVASNGAYPEAQGTKRANIKLYVVKHTKPGNPRPNLELYSRIKCIPQYTSVYPKFAKIHVGTLTRVLVELPTFIPSR